MPSQTATPRARVRDERGVEVAPRRDRGVLVARRGIRGERQRHPPPARRDEDDLGDRRGDRELRQLDAEPAELAAARRT